MTRSGPADPAGRLLRRTWQPAALLEELEASPRPLKTLRLLGQDLVLFRDEGGRVGLIDRDCPHRGADLGFGRLENGGLRCLFHGWLFDVEGNCLETPAEPRGSTLCSRVRQRSYPVRVVNGIVFAFLGEGDPPAMPALDCFTAPESHVFAFKGYLDCNWLQALEIGIDPAHASFLHRYFEDADAAASYGQQFRAKSVGSDMTMTQVLREHTQPTLQVEKSAFGLRIAALRPLADGSTHVRVTNLVFPEAFVIPLSAEMTITQWHVPVDDESCYWYAHFTSFTAPVDKAEMRRQRLQLYTLPHYQPRLGRHNDYGYSLNEQRTSTYTGMGEDINVHDQWAVESQGRIQDRSREHLGTSDKAIVAYRQMLLGQIAKLQRGEPTMLDLDAGGAERLVGPVTVDGICLDQDWRGFSLRVDAGRRQAAPWHARPIADDGA